MSKVFTIRVLNVNEAPVKINITDDNGQLSFSQDLPSVDENSPSGTVIGRVIGFDYDYNDLLSFRLDDDAGGRFALGSVTCITNQPVEIIELVVEFFPKSCTSFQVIKTKCWTSLLVNGTLDYEINKEHSIVVRTTDSKQLALTREFRVKIVDTNDSPDNIVFSVSGEPSIEENRNNVSLGEFSSVDQDQLDKHAYTLVDSAGGRFTIRGNQLVTSTTANLNYELKSLYKIIVRSTDSGSPPRYFDKTFDVRVLDVNEIPTAVALPSNDVPENSAKGTLVGSLTTTDPDNQATVRQTFTYTLINSADGRFEIDGNVVKVASSNVLCLKYGGVECKIDFESARSHDIVVRVTDSGSPPLEKDFVLTVRVTDANDQPRSLRIDNFQVKENEPAGTWIGNFSADDEDRGQKLSFKLTDDDNGQFKLVGHQLLKAKQTDYETKTSHRVTVVVEDDGIPRKSVSH